MTRFEQDYYNDVSSIEKSLKRIADALEKVIINIWALVVHLTQII